MLMLPRLDDLPANPRRGGCGGSMVGEPQRTARSGARTSRHDPLKSCFHLNGNGCVDLESLQQRKLLKNEAAQRQRALQAQSQEGAAETANSSEDPGLAAPKSTARRRKEQAARPLTPLSSTRSTSRYNGVEGISLSQVGSWLDSRCFREACEAAGASPRNLGAARRRPTAQRRGGELSEQERFILKRCKDTLMRRYGTLQNAFKKLDCNHSQQLAMVEFVDATTSLFRKSEAQLLYRLLDRNCDQVVTFEELMSQLEDV
mmetsp:Transcript_35840/g.100825  ORF Transcript_35840/g.100825 Transcript_35840/m.100825 type:complete len:260 (-) Transcript_35840:91-870(-)|eukprot:CAMPEP_0179298128 /NCGR_PEP_ID=MMETSP0797-20121207/45832_1 /TAXON_ID=47934 /ORGANISM="Dinophysis acuminata, Strain DAEP01" /LENGTH=259 /DNA_ID=CAMNT_0021007503 /DNA_START=85 /DNA_END=864 /DNA_ORIENTATION=-